MFIYKYNDMKEEYNRDVNPYPSFGKKYNGEKAVISLTSWKARINTVSKTLFSLIQQCPGFHIVLVLSEEEFPKMCEELPENLMLFVENEMIELLWVYRNYKSFKKVLFTMDKYRDVPVISADDDCIYTCNYAQELYDKWKVDDTYCYKFSFASHKWDFMTQGPATLYSPLYFNLLISSFAKYKIKDYRDDGFMETIFKKINRKILDCGHHYFPFNFHDEFCPINGGSRNYLPHWNRQYMFR